MNSNHFKMSRAFKTVALTMIVFSLLVQVTALALSTGYGKSKGAIDSRGNKVGFNEPLTQEHLGMLITRASLVDCYRSLNPVEVAILMAHGLALILLFSRRTSWFLVAVFAVTQGIALFWGALGVLMLLAHLSGPAWTGESIVEGPLSTIAAGGVWFVVSCVLLVWLANTNQLWSLFRRDPIRVPSVQIRG